MRQMPNSLTFRWLGGALFAFSLVASGCDNDDAAVDQPMRSMQETALPRVTAKSLAPKPLAEKVVAARAPVAPPAVETEESPRVAPHSESKPAIAAQGKSDREFSVKRLVLTHGIKDKEPLPTQSFEADGTPVFAFVELSNPAQSSAKIEIVFEHESGRRVGFVKLDVPGQHERWRTWGQTRQIRESGRWVAVVRTGDGQELMRKSFAVSAG